MKARNREVNIFNMSLLDILCGALGAFCFLMLVLFPYYSPNASKSKAPDVPPGVDPKSLEEAKARIRELEAALKKFQDYAAQIEAQNRQLSAQVAQLQQQTQQASQKMNQYEMRNPFLATMDMAVTKDDDLELYIEDSRVTKGGRSGPKADVNKRQGAAWGGDLAATSGSGSMGYFMVRDGPPGEYHVLLKVLKHNPSGPPISGSIMIDTTSQYNWTGVANFRKEQGIIPVAVIQVDQDHKQKIQSVVPAEYTAQALKPRLPPQPPQPASQKK